MATTEEIVVKYRLELDELKGQVNQLSGELKKADAAAKETGKSLDDAFGKFGDKLKDLGKAVVAAFAVEKIIGFGKASVEAFAEAEKGALKLRSAVSASGGLQKDFDALTKQAEDLAGITIFDDDAIKAAQTLALQFGLNSSAVAKLIPKVADFAAATGQDLTAALQATLGGINGQVDGLKRFGIELDTSATKNERFAAVVDQLTGKFNGQAEALTKTLGGSIGQAEKAFGELQETIGAALAPAVTAAAQALTGLFNAFQDAPQDPLVDEIAGIEVYRSKLLDTNTTVAERGKIIDELKTKYPQYLEYLDKDKTTNEELSKALNTVSNELVDQLVLRQQTAAVEEKQVKLNEARAEQAEAEGRVAKLLVEARNKGIVVEDKYVTLLDRGKRAVELLFAQARKSTGDTSLAIRDLGNDIDNAINFDGVFNPGLIQTIDKVTEAERNLQQQQKTRGDVLKELGIQTEKSTSAATVATTTGLEKKTAAELAADKKAQEERAKAAADARQKALAAAEKQAVDELKIREQLGKDELAQDLENLTTNDAERKRAIEKRFNDETNAAKAAATQQQADLLQQLQAGLISYEEYTKKKQAILDAVPNTDKQRQRALLANDIQTLELQLQNQADYNVKDEKLAQDLADKKAALQQLDVQLSQDAADERIKTAEEEAQAKGKLLDEEEERRKKFNDATIQSAQKLADGILAVLSVQAENEQAALEEQRKVQGEEYDAQQADLDAQLQKRLISQQVYEQRSAQIKELRAKSEEEVSKKVADIKKRQDAQAKASALFRIGIDTAAAIQAQLKETPLPAGAFFVAAIAASGLLQAGAVLAAKPPQYAEGIDYVPLGKNRPGRDTIPAYLDEGERVISRRKNLRHWDLYQAIDEDRLDRYVFQNYTLPTLLAEKARGGDVGRALGSLFGEAASSGGGLDSQELRRLWRRGLPITNLGELADLLGRHAPSPYRA